MNAPGPWRTLGLAMAGARGVGATGVGSLPGEDPREAARLVAGELASLPALPELPARGPGAGLIGRGSALLAGLHVDLQPAGWRLVARPGIDLRRARDFLVQDLDAFEEALAGHRGPVKVQATGPWTLAASVELPRGGAVLRDSAAVVDVIQSLAAGLAEHIAEVRRRLPSAGPLLLALDEPLLPAVLAGQIRSASGFSTLPIVESRQAIEGLGLVLNSVVAAGGLGGVHCCAQAPPVALLRSAGAAFLSLDATLIGRGDDTALGEAVEGGTGLLLGCVPSTGEEGGMSDLALTVAPVRALWSRLGLDPELLAEVVVVTPTCGLAGASPAYARAALSRCQEAARMLAEAPEGGEAR